MHASPDKFIISKVSREANVAGVEAATPRAPLAQNHRDDFRGRFASNTLRGTHALRLSQSNLVECVGTF